MIVSILVRDWFIVMPENLYAIYFLIAGYFIILQIYSTEDEENQALLGLHKNGYDYGRNQLRDRVDHYLWDYLRNH
jgi:hypothetical protein